MGPSARCAAAAVSLPSSVVLYNGRHRVERRRRQCLGVPQASAQPSAATASAIISSGRDGSVASAAASSVQPSAASSARARRSRASITATSTLSRCTTAPIVAMPVLQPCACAIGCSHATRSVGAATRARARLYNSTVLASSAVPLRIRTNAVHLCGSGSAGLGGAPAHAQRTPAQQTAHRPSPRDDDACGVGRAIAGVFCNGHSQTNKQTNKQTSVEPNGRRGRRGSCEQM